MIFFVVHALVVFTILIHVSWPARILWTVVLGAALLYATYLAGSVELALKRTDDFLVLWPLASITCATILWPFSFLRFLQLANQRRRARLIPIRKRLKACIRLSNVAFHRDFLLLIFLFGLAGLFLSEGYIQTGSLLEALGVLEKELHDTLMEVGIGLLILASLISLLNGYIFVSNFMTSRKRGQ